MSRPAGTPRQVEVLQLLVSPVHRFSGRPADGPAGEPDELVDRIEVLRDRGIVGDRYFAQRAHRDAAVTIMAVENLPLDINASAGLLQTRRNILLRGVDIDTYLGATVSLDSGSGPVAFALNRAARPCAWMDTTIGPGAQRALRNRGGVRCTPLSDGLITLGPARFAVVSLPTAAGARPGKVRGRSAGHGARPPGAY
ncbi:molybdenum cofactor biosysynthesis protein [Streptomyces sp. NPDC093675]|uniref:molybdenum cofactor biosysynthesis protein n=1 Tax=Streptomyces sp. NPDC093675 TaxID=3366049 RepID=UPI00382E08EB